MRCSLRPGNLRLGHIPAITCIIFLCPAAIRWCPGARQCQAVPGSCLDGLCDGAEIGLQKKERVSQACEKRNHGLRRLDSLVTAATAESCTTRRPTEITSLYSTVFVSPSTQRQQSRSTLDVPPSYQTRNYLCEGHPLSLPSDQRRGPIHHTQHVGLPPRQPRAARVAI